MSEEDLVVALIARRVSDATGRHGAKAALNGLAWLRWEYPLWVSDLGIETDIRGRALENEQTLNRLFNMILTDRLGEYYERQREYEIA